MDTDVLIAETAAAFAAYDQPYLDAIAERRRRNETPSNLDRTVELERLIALCVADLGGTTTFAFRLALQDARFAGQDHESAVRTAFAKLAP